MVPAGSHASAVSEPRERIEALDALRGAALFGVLQVNLLTDFRVPLLMYLERFHTHPGWANHAVDWALGLLVESKAFALFSLLFGAGLALQIDRGGAGYAFLARRCGALLVIGLLHHFLLWNGDILALYGALGLLVGPLLLGARAAVLPSAALFGAVASLHRYDPIPHGARAQAEIDAAMRAYSAGGYLEIFSFRLHESKALIAPLLAASSPRVVSLFLIGAWAARSGLLDGSEAARRRLGWAAALALPCGAAATALQAHAASSGASLGGWGGLVNHVAVCGLGVGYGAAGLLALGRPRLGWLRAPLASIGRVALSQYLLQSLVFSLVFYGHGLGLFGRHGSAPVAAFGALFYALQVALSAWWLGRFRQGPVEAVWRKISRGW